MAIFARSGEVITVRDVGAKISKRQENEQEETQRAYDRALTAEQKRPMAKLDPEMERVVQ